MHSNNSIWIADDGCYCSLGDTICATDLPVVIVEDDEAFITTAKSHLIAAIVPPVGERLTIHHVTEDNHVPENTSHVCHCTCNTSKATWSRKQKQLLLLLVSPQCPT